MSYKAITTKYVATNTRGARIVATDGDGNRVNIFYPNDLPDEQRHRAAARALCKKMGWTGRLAEGTLMSARRKTGKVFVFLGTCNSNVFNVKDEG